MTSLSNLFYIFNQMNIDTYIHADGAIETDDHYLLLIVMTSDWY